MKHTSISGQGNPDVSWEGQKAGRMGKMRTENRSDLQIHLPCISPYEKVPERHILEVCWGSYYIQICNSLFPNMVKNAFVRKILLLTIFQLPILRHLITIVCHEAKLSQETNSIIEAPFLKVNRYNWEIQMLQKWREGWLFLASLQNKHRFVRKETRDSHFTCSVR